DNCTLKYIFETHFHADFVSGHIDLSKSTGAPIVYGPDAACEFECISAADGQEFKFGDVTIKVLHTPGHTLESTTYLLKDEAGKDYCIFSGDTLFLGDVGRPDLAQKSAHMTQEELAGLLYESLQSKIMPLADDVIVYPAHGAGSACGKNMMKQTIDTLGNQKKVNYALNQPDKESFIKAVTEGLLPPPAYFPQNVSMNKKGYRSFEEVLNQGMTALSPHDFERMAEEHGAILLDTRTANDFIQAFIPQSINIGLRGDFAPWVGALMEDVNQPILLITVKGEEAETVTRLSRVGFDHVIGHLKGGIEAWIKAGKEVDSITRVQVDELKNNMNAPDSHIIDIRRESEFEEGHVLGAENLPLANINEWIMDINPKDHYFIHCRGGYRSMIAASILQARGYRNFSEIEGGIDVMKQVMTIENN
ncbi:MAG: MBL fold metallo-hydrolase, partial [Saprospiraceae bacterium]